MTERTLKRGSEGSEVSRLQEMLIELRFKPGEVDGLFGVLTQSAVKMYQATLQLEADGIVGPLTWERLNEAAGGQDEVVDRLVAERGARRGHGRLLEAIAELSEPIAGPASADVLDEIRADRL